MSNKILNLLYNKINSDNHNINFNIKKILKEDMHYQKDIIELPIEPEKSDWENIDNKLVKFYSFGSIKHKIYFLNNIISHGNYLSHDPVIVIRDDIVYIELFTKNINDVTDADIAFSKYIDEIHGDIKYIGSL